MLLSLSEQFQQNSARSDPTNRPGFHTIVESSGTSMIGLLRKDEPDVILTSYSAVNLKLSKWRPCTAAKVNSTQK